MTLAEIGGGDVGLAGGHGPPDLGGDARLITEPDDNDLVTTIVGVGDGGPQRGGLAVVPTFVVQDGDVVGHDGNEIDATRHHDHFVELGGASRVDGVAHDRLSPHDGQQLVNGTVEAGPGAGREHHRGDGGGCTVWNRPGLLRHRPSLAARTPGETPNVRAMDESTDATVPVTPNAPPTVRVTMLLADSAQVADGKLYILGGGITVVGPRPQPMGVVIRIEVPWDRANVTHQWRLDLLDEDGHPLIVRDQPLVVHGRFEAGRPAGLKPGTPLSVPLAINFPTVPVTPGKSYTWQLAIDGSTQVDWRQSFHVRTGNPARPPAPPPTPFPEH